MSTTTNPPTTQDNNLTQSLLSSPPSHHPHDPETTAATRAMAGKRALDRRQRWSAQEYKHEQLRRKNIMSTFA
jgi:hypothetical protein